MQIAAVEAFISVCDTGSFRQAAARLHLTQPAISKRIATLERELGHPLFDRVGRGVLLTEAGRNFLPHARSLLTEMTDAKRALDSLSDHVAGQLGLALSHHVALHRMPPLLRRFVDTYPDVRLDLRFLGSEAACEAVSRGQIELAVITLPDPSIRQLEQRTIWSDPMRVLVARHHALARQTRVSASDLVAIPALLPEPETYTYRIVAEALAVFGLAPTGHLASNYLETLRMLASVGLGWTALPATMAGDDLIALDIPELSLRRSLGTVRHPDRHLSNAALAMLNLLHKHSQDSNPADMA